MTPKAGQASTQGRSQPAHNERSKAGLPPHSAMAWPGQALRQRSHCSRPRQRPALKASSTAKDWDSGLLHQRQARGQPLRKMMVRMPGPSWIEYFWMLKTSPRVSLSVMAVMGSSVFPAWRG